MISSDINVFCTLAGSLCAEGGIVGTTLCTLACNELLRVPTNSLYHRSLVADGQHANWRLFDHYGAYLWYTQTISNGTNDGFYYSPWTPGGGNPFPPRLRSNDADGESPEQQALEEPVTTFQTFGNVVEVAGTYQMTEEADAGIFKEMAFPIGAESLTFSYRFTSPGTATSSLFTGAPTSSSTSVQTWN